MKHWNRAGLIGVGVTLLALGCGLGNTNPSQESIGFTSTGATTPAAKSVTGTYTGADGSVIAFDTQGLVSVELGSAGAKEIDKLSLPITPLPTRTPTSQPFGTVPPPPPVDGLGSASGDSRPLLARPFKNLTLADIVAFHRQEIQKTITTTWSSTNVTVVSTLDMTSAASQATDTGWTNSMNGTLTRQVTLGSNYGTLAGTYLITRIITGNVQVTANATGQTLTAVLSGSITTTGNTVPAQANLPIPGPDWNKTITLTLSRSS